MKKILKVIFTYLGYEIKKVNSNNILINPNEFKPFKDNNDNFKLYYKALKKSQVEWSDNYYKRMSSFSLMELIRYSLKKNEVNDFVECGCWKGHSSYIISHLISEYKKEINFHIFDSFEGMSKIKKEDEVLLNIKEERKINNTWAGNESFVKNQVLKDFNFFKIYKGWIPSSFKEVESKKFSFVYIDVVLYEPTLETIKFFFPKLEKGGVIYCESYNSSTFQGAKNAWDEYFKDKNYTFFFQNPIRGCFIVK